MRHVKDVVKLMDNNASMQAYKTSIQSELFQTSSSFNRDGNCEHVAESMTLTEAHPSLNKTAKRMKAAEDKSELFKCPMAAARSANTVVYLQIYGNMELLLL